MWKSLLDPAVIYVEAVLQLSSHPHTSMGGSRDHRSPTLISPITRSPFLTLLWKNKQKHHLPWNYPGYALLFQKVLGAEAKLKNPPSPKAVWRHGQGPCLCHIPEREPANACFGRVFYFKSLSQPMEWISGLEAFCRIITWGRWLETVSKLTWHCLQPPWLQSWPQSPSCSLEACSIQHRVKEAITLICSWAPSKGLTERCSTPSDYFPVLCKASSVTYH